MDEFESLLAQSRTAVERWVKARVSHYADAEDIIQDTYLATGIGRRREEKKFCWTVSRNGQRIVPMILRLRKRWNPCRRRIG